MVAQDYLSRATVQMAKASKKTQPAEILRNFLINSISITQHSNNSGDPVSSVQTKEFPWPNTTAEASEPYRRPRLLAD